MWQFSVKDRQWRSYGRGVNDAVDLAFRQAQRSANLTVGGKALKIDFREMKQSMGDQVGCVRRADPYHGGRASKNIPPSAWQYQDADGAWRDFAKHAGKIVDEAYRMGEAGAWYSLSGNEFVVSFMDMRQGNPRSGAVRPIRRRDGVVAAPFFPLPNGKPTGLAKIPMGWSRADDPDEVYEIELLGVPLADAERVEQEAVERSFHESMKHRLISIKRVQNMRLWQAYLEHRGRGNVREEFLWQGCCGDVVEAVMREGFSAVHGDCQLHWSSVEASHVVPLCSDMILVRACFAQGEKGDEVDQKRLYPAYVVEFQP
mmetsp:Transcript_89956/g.259273  ORF Transcript_89956/g.259273 Transcript_89956/m.259273 type:complete len:315 (-) Transcript_89956:258-1202(-)